jgi:hypothetical protein
VEGTVFVYVIGHSAAGPVKVGHSVDPAIRCADLQTGNPERLAVLFQVECGERRLSMWPYQTMRRT